MPLPRYSDEEVEAARALLYDERCSYAETAERSGIPEGTLKAISQRKKWPSLKEKRQKGEKAADPIWNNRRVYDVGPALKNTDAEVEWIRLHRKRDAEFSRMVLREAVRIGLVEVGK